ncbi:hypothetical protein Taro_017153 [Colocasia esculenta]|uniref:Transposase (putative) gypsy type domain-containing protein n=1 Tax=Colocasia esculenta TaxID=4460 RepID=A0A843UV51_COLES|nr:hypothetical protein [Colocasia esculenta]
MHRSRSLRASSGIHPGGQEAGLMSVTSGDLLSSYRHAQKSIALSLFGNPSRWRTGGWPDECDEWRPPLLVPSCTEVDRSRASSGIHPGGGQEAGSFESKKEKKRMGGGGGSPHAVAVVAGVNPAQSRSPLSPESYRCRHQSRPPLQGSPAAAFLSIAVVPQLSFPLPGLSCEWVVENSHHTCPPRLQVARKPECLRAGTCSGVISAINAKGKKIVEASRMPPVAAKAAKYRSFEGLRERFWIGEEYDIVLMREDDSYLTLKPGCFVLSLDLLEAGLRLPMPEIAKELLRSWKVAPIQLTPNSWRTIFVFCIICRKKKIEATADIFRNHFSLECSPQSGMGIVYVKHHTNRMRTNFSPRLSNNKGWTGRLFSVGRQQGANIPEWDFPVRVVEPVRKVDMPPFLIGEAAAASQLLNTVGVNHAEGYLTEYKLVKCKLSRAWGSAKGSAQQAKAVTRGGAVKKALEMATTTEATSLPQTKRKEKRKAAMVELQAGGRSSEEGVSDEPRARKKRKMTKLMPHVAEGAAVVEEEAEEDLEPLLARRSRQRMGTSEERASATPAVDHSEAVMKMSAELGLIMVSDESDRSGGRAKSPVREAQEVLPSEGSAEQGGAPDEGTQLGAEDGVVTSDLTPVPAAVCGSGEAVLLRGDVPQRSEDILPPMPPTLVVTEGRVVGEDAVEVPRRAM